MNLIVHNKNKKLVLSFRILLNLIEQPRKALGQNPNTILKNNMNNLNKLLHVFAHSTFQNTYLAAELIKDIRVHSRFFLKANSLQS